MNPAECLIQRRSSSLSNSRFEQPSLLLLAASRWGQNIHAAEGARNSECGSSVPNTEASADIPFACLSSPPSLWDCRTCALSLSGKHSVLCFIPNQVRVKEHGNRCRSQEKDWTIRQSQNQQGRAQYCVQAHFSIFEGKEFHLFKRT